MPAKKISNKTGRAPLAAGSGSAWTRYAWQIAALWILALAAYSNSFDAGLVFDNAAIIGNDPRIRAATPDTLGAIFTQGYWYDNTTSGLYRPLTTLSYLLNYAGFDDGLQPLGYHLVNLALHDLNILLVYALGLMIFAEWIPAFALAALWGVHPLLTESVTNIVGRADLLAGFGVLAGLLCYMRGAAATGRKRFGWLTALASAQTVGIFSKESAVILPAVMLLYDFAWPRKEEWRRRILPYAALVVPFAAFFTFRWQVHSRLVIPFSENPLAGAGFWTSRITAVKVIGKFLWVFLWPARLSADYSFNAIPLFGWRIADWEDAKAVIALVVCAGLIAFGIWFRRRNPALVFFVGFFFVALAPTSNLLIPIGSIAAERFMYLPAIGLAGCLVIALREMVQSRLKWVAAVAICLAFGLRTYARNFDWRDDASLWTSAVAAYPESARPHLNLGNVLLQRSDLPNAILQFEAALRIRPDYAEAHYNVGKALAQIPGRLPDAIAEYQASVRNPPDYSPRLHYTNAYISLGNVLARVPGKMPEAIAQYGEALKVDPTSAEAHYNLGNALARTDGRIADAIGEWQAAIRLQPGLAEAHYNLGIVYSQAPDHLPEAIAQFRTAISYRPDYADAHYGLGLALLQVQGRQREAVEEMEAAVRIRPDAERERMIDEALRRAKVDGKSH